jgi:hypothetical protein
VDEHHGAAPVEFLPDWVERVIGDVASFVPFAVGRSQVHPVRVELIEGERQLLERGLGIARNRKVREEAEAFRVLDDGAK